MTLDIVFPHVGSSLEPRPMKAQEIWSVADQVRRQLTRRPQVPCLDLDRLTRASAGMRVNGITIAAHWDFERSIRDSRGRDALGVTEADPAVPGVVLISLNAELIAERDYLKRSTLAHEFGCVGSSQTTPSSCGCGPSARRGRPSAGSSAWRGQRPTSGCSTR